MSEKLGSAKLVSEKDLYEAAVEAQAKAEAEPQVKKVESKKSNKK